MSLSLSEQLKQKQLAYPPTLLGNLQRLRHLIVSEGEQHFGVWHCLIEREVFLPSACNLAYYLSLRQQDMREIQLALMPWGLSIIPWSE
jgi:pyruvate kinase